MGRYPLGVYDDEPPEDVPFLRSVGVGSSGAAKLARTLTNVTDEVSDFLDSINPLP